MVGSQMSEMEKPIGHLTGVTVEGLFGRRHISFQLDKVWPTILTGSNGSGKSTILRIVDAIGTGDWARLVSLPFTAARLDFEDGSTVSVDRRNGSTVFSLDEREWPFSLDSAERDFDVDDLVRDAARRVGQDAFEYEGERYTRSELNRLLFSERLIELSGPEYEWVSDFIERFPILFITDQRLVVSEDPRPGRALHGAKRRSAAVLDAKRDLRDQISDGLATYASQSQLLDRDFPHRVVAAMATSQDVDLESLGALLDEVSEERKQLQAVGLLPREAQPGPFQELPLDRPHVAPVIETFLNDTKKKFAVLSDLRERLSLFTSFLNQHYQSKSVSAHPGEGFVIEVDSDDAERGLGPTMLSSGEQQILVLAYEILFRSVPGTLVLIDEPELSLHVVWQDTFLDDVTRMGSIRDLQFLLATHSPSLIGGREDLIHSLDQG